LYSSHQADQSPSTAASRREAERLREARCPPEAYGSRVHRRLRARWFSLVPVRRRTLFTVAGLFAAVAALLAAAHYASVAWPSIAYESEIARPLRLDRPDSFGRWFMVALLAGSSGASFLIYQLRRYRNDDFQGHYRLWRLVLIVLMLASLNSLVSIVDWGGALLDFGFGKRVALAGSDWIRIVLSIGGAVLALRLVAEVRRCRFALGMMLVACALVAIPEAAKWNMLEVDSIGEWAVVTSAPLLACTALFISLVGYLRMLYREVRRIEGNGSLRDRFQQMRLRVFRQSEREQDEPQTEPRGRQPKRRRQSVAEVEEQIYEDEEVAEDSEFKDGEEESASRGKRRWFGLRRAKTASVKKAEESGGDESDGQSAPQKKRRFSMRLAPQSNKPAEDKTGVDSQADAGTNEERARKRRGWLRRKQGAEPNDDAPRDESPTKQAVSKSAAERSDEDSINADEIDWNSLSKADRRRLRKQLKRQNRAA
jgi:hypothetical protein